MLSHADKCKHAYSPMSSMLSGKTCNLAYMNSGNRIKQRRKELDLSQLELAKLVGVSRPAVAQWETSETKSLKQENLLAVASALGVSAQWLVYGDEKRGKPTMTDIPPGASVGVWENLEDLPKGTYLTIPHYDVNVSAGPGAEAAWIEHDDNDPIVFRVRWFKAKGIKPENCKCLYVKGSSMEPELRDRDTVMIDISQTTIKDDEIYAILYHDELYIKRLFRLPGGGVELRSDNPRHPTREISGQDLEHLKVLGLKVYRSG